MSTITWTKQSISSAESMPIGGFDLGINYWVEQEEVLLYFGRGDSFDENNTLLKSGRIRIKFDGNVVFVSQSLDIYRSEGKIQLKVNGEYIEILIHPSAFESMFNILINSNNKISASLSYENWRFEDSILPNDNSRWKCKGLYKYEGEVLEYKDKFDVHNDKIYFYHQNKNAFIINKTLQQQNLLEYFKEVNNTITDNVFGGMIYLDGASSEGYNKGQYSDTKYISYNFKLSNKKQIRIAVHLLNIKTKNITEFKNHLYMKQDQYSYKKDRIRTEKWWLSKFEDSYIYMSDKSNKANEMSRNYNLFRYMLLCNNRGRYPTKFNGGLFTTDPMKLFEDEYQKENINSSLKEKNQTQGISMKKFNPDFRLWGGIFTGQNQRLVYWPMLFNGDFETMESLFDLYNKNLNIARKISYKYWGHDGAMFSEQLENFGVSSGSEYGWSKNEMGHRRYGNADFTELDSPYTKNYFGSQLEVCFMILKYRRYSGKSILKYYDLLKYSLLFFYEHYKYLNYTNTLKEFEEEKLVIFPSTASETYKNATNPTDVIAGLKATIPLFIEEFRNTMELYDKATFRDFLNALPEIPLGNVDGHVVIKPAEHYTSIINNEIPQLYPVFPYNLVSSNEILLESAKNTWIYGLHKKEQRGYISWHQDNIFLPMLGFRNESKVLAEKKLGNGPFRFPSFWGPGYDWTPDHNWGGTGMLGLQKMIVQEDGEFIYILPCWPEEWKIQTKIHLEDKSYIEFSFFDKKLNIIDSIINNNKKIIFKGEILCLKS